VIDRSFSVPLVVVRSFCFPWYSRSISDECSAPRRARLGDPGNVRSPSHSSFATSRGNARLLPYAYLGLPCCPLLLKPAFSFADTIPLWASFDKGKLQHADYRRRVTVDWHLRCAPILPFLCPYGVLLRWVSAFSKWRITITPAECIQCRLCESSCPYGAIVVPTPNEPLPDRRSGARRLGILLLLSPVIIGRPRGQHGGARTGGTLASTCAWPNVSQRKSRAGALKPHSIQTRSERESNLRWSCTPTRMR